MKKNIFSWIGYAGIFALVLLSSCEKDDLHSKELVVFLQADKAGIPTKTQTVPFIHNSVEIKGQRKISIRGYASREVPAQVELVIEPNTGLLAAYNTQNGTACLALPENAYQINNGNAHSIAAGSLAADSMEIEIIRPQDLTSPAGYILPLTITSINSKDKGARISNTHATVYLKVTYEFNNIATTEVQSAGTLIARTGWVATVSNVTNGAPATALLDGSNTTSWRSSNSATAVKWFQVDMGSARMIKGFNYVPTYTTVTENATRMTISTSLDNITWTNQGIWNGTGPLATSTATNPDIKGVTLVAPVSARYFRFDITSWVSGNRVGFAEINAVQP